MVLMPSLVKQIFAQRQAVLSNRSVRFWFAKHGFGDEGVNEKMQDLSYKASAHVNILMTEPAYMDAADRTAQGVGTTISSLISFTEDPGKQQRWEKGANIKVLNARAAEAEVEVNLFHLVTRWAYSCSTPAMFGKAFPEHFPNAMDDMFVFDDQFPMFLTGLPPFNPKMARARAAGKRLLNAIEEWSQALEAVEDGKGPMAGWGDMKDVGEVAKLLARTWRSGGKAAEKGANANLFGLLFALHTVSADSIPPLFDRSLRPHR